MTTTDTTGALDTLVRQLAEVQEQKVALNQREEALKAAVRAIAPVGKTSVAGLTLSLTQVRTLDTAAAERAYPRAEHPALYVLTLDTKKLKAAVAPDALELLLVPQGEPRVSLR